MAERAGLLYNPDVARPELITVVDACREFKISRPTLYEYLKRFGPMRKWHVPGDRKAYYERKQLERLFRPTRVRGTALAPGDEPEDAGSK